MAGVKNNIRRLLQIKGVYQRIKNKKTGIRDRCICGRSYNSRHITEEEVVRKEKEFLKMEGLIDYDNSIVPETVIKKMDENKSNHRPITQGVEKEIRLLNQKLLYG